MLHPVFTFLKGAIAMVNCRYLGRILAVSACIVMASTGQAHCQYSNQWINYSQSYYKVQVAAEGIYRITYADLQGAGAPVGSIDPRRFNLFHRGVEQAIIVAGENDAVFDPADFIEFYGKKNDGVLDADLYAPAVDQPHQYYNLYSDTTAYFLTWNPLPVPGLRAATFFEVNNQPLPTESAHRHEQLELYTSQFADVGELQLTSYTMGEGWTGSMICTLAAGCTGQQDFQITNLSGGVPAAGNPTLEILLTGRGAMAHLAEIYAGANGGSQRLVGSSSFFGYQTVTLSLPLNSSDIGGDGKMIVRVKVTATGVRDQFSVSYIKVTLPQNFDAASSTEKTLHIVPNGGGKSYIEISNPAPGTRIWDVNAPDPLRLIGTVNVSGRLGAVVPDTQNGRHLFLSSVFKTPVIQPVNFRQIFPSLHNYIIISHRSLMKAALGYSDAVKAYAEYRASAAGGGYDTLLVDIDQLYNQFNYGEKSPRAIYQFMKYLDAGGDPKFLFLIGKGLEVTNGYFRKASFLPSDFHDLVPSAGLPGSDMAFTAGLAGTTSEPGIPTGRLTASTAVQVASYLNKVKESEALAFDEMWRKDILHLSGGINPGEPQLFRSFVDGFKVIAEDFYLGGKVSTISKQTLNVELINVKDEVNKGLDLITFYGHSGPGTIDIDIGYVSDPTLGYQNAGKYPGFLINGCNAGRFFDNRVTFGEDWMLTANKGAKAFIAHSSFGFTGALRQYSELFYSVAFGDSTYIHKGVGEIQKETARRYLLLYGGGVSGTSQVQQMVLLGDPAVQLFGANKPDYETQDGSLSVVAFDNEEITAQTDSFAIEIPIRNFGRAHPTPIRVRVERTLNDNSVITYDSIISPVMYTESVRFIIRRGNGGNEFGNNLFTVILDADQVIDELNEANNISSVLYFIPSNGSKNIFPAPFAIVPQSNTNLVFQHTDLTSESRSFKIEVDTSAGFDSPYLNRKTLTGKGLIKFPLTLLPDDSLVYYWRTRLESPLPGESTKWTASSFVHIIGSPEGWAQIKFPQFLENDSTGLTWNRLTQKLEYFSTVSDVDVMTFGSANSGSPSAVSLKINTEEFNVSSQGQPCRNNTLNLIAFDRSSTAPYAGIPFNFSDPRSCGREPQQINSFTVAELESSTNGLAQWIANIKSSDSVVLFSIGDAGYASWSSATKLRLEQLGIGGFQISSLLPGEPFVIFGKKNGATGTANIFRAPGAPANAQSLTVNETITGRFIAGSISSGLIGPASQWNALSLQVTGTTPEDEVALDIVGISLSGQETLIRQVQPGVELVSDIDPTLYPYLKLVLHLGDSVNLTPGQLKKWTVTFVPVAEGVVTYKGGTETEAIPEGQEWKSSYAFTNISTRTFSDSLTVRADVYSQASRSLDRQTFRVKAPLPGDTVHFDISVNTVGKGGLNDVTVFVNPRVLPEVYYDNNILPLYARLNVEADESGPILDVTIDGRHIVNGDVVASSPAIRTTVIDHNPFLLKQDTTGFNLFMQFPCDDLTDCPFTRISFTDPHLTWTPATATEEFQVLYTPQQLAVGNYVMKVEASDANGNTSGDEPYEVMFVVKDETVFKLQSVYPNPSSEFFYFKLFIGNSIPDDFRLDIFSSTGSSVRVVGNEALSSLHVGTNEIQVRAAGVDGSQLPPGIYIYRFMVVTAGKQFVESGRLVVVR